MEQSYTVDKGEKQLPQIHWLAVVAKAASTDIHPYLSWVQVTETTALATDGHRLHFMSFEPDQSPFPAPGYYRPETVRKTYLAFAYKEDNPGFPDCRRLFPFPVDPEALTWRPMLHGIKEPIQLSVSEIYGQSAARFIGSLPRADSGNHPEHTANLEYVKVTAVETPWFQGQVSDLGPYLFTDTEDSTRASLVAIIMPMRV